MMTLLTLAGIIVGIGLGWTLHKRSAFNSISLRRKNVQDCLDNANMIDLLNDEFIILFDRRGYVFIDKNGKQIPNVNKK